ncbi:MAG TPA: serine/threonine-protein kinase, partial [Phycisphaerae bacterium]|nr:serine/threonine-protein kinase [Phycisphaerae bacterium]
CEGDVELREFVEQLLNNDQSGPDGFLGTPVVESMAPQPPPPRIGRYLVARVIGEGGMGVVYEARQDLPQRTVALKVIRPGLASRGLLRRFQLEAEVLGQLQHPGIAHIYEAGTAELVSPGGHKVEQPFFAMEYIRGKPLIDAAEEGQLKLRDRLELIARIADAVHHAHQHGVVHRDLKPGNILVDAQGQPKILDFGVARLTDSDTQTITLQTDVGQLVGTIPYMSPEQVTGDSRQIDTRSDVYALGVLMYELLTGRLPHDLRNRSIPEAARIIREEEPSRLSSVNTVFRGDVETIVAKAIEKEKDRRYQSAEQLAADIRRYLRDEPIVARPATRMYQLRKFARRNKLLVGATAAIILVLTVGVIGTTWFAVREGRERKLAEELLVESRAARDAEKRERQRAEERFQQVRKLANTLIFDVYDKIINLAGATEAKQFIVKTGLSYLDSLSADAEGDLPLQKQIANGYQRLGDVQGKNSLSNVGDLAAAIQSYEKAMKIVESMRKLEPESREVLKAYATCQDSLAMALRASGRTGEAIEHLNIQLATLEKLVQRYPKDQDLEEEAAIAAANVGRMQAATGNREAALDNYKKYQTLIHARAEAHPTDRTFRYNAAMIDSKVAELLGEMDRPTETIALYRTAIAETRAVVKDFPADAGARALLAGILIETADYFNDHDLRAEAMSSYDEVLKIRKELAAADPEDFHAQRNLAAAWYGIGMAHQEAGRWQQALEAFTASRDGFARVMESNPTYVVVQRDLGLAEDRVGNALGNVGRLSEALPHHQKYRELSEALVKKDPLDAMARDDLMKSYYALGEYFAKVGARSEISPERRVEQWREAQSWFDRSQDTLEKLRKDGKARPVSEMPRKIEAARDECRRELARLSSPVVAKTTSQPAGNS